MKHSILFLFFLFSHSLGFIPTTEERILHAIRMGFSHEPWRNDSIVIHWDFSFPRSELEDFAKKHRWTARMDWGRDVHMKMQRLSFSYQRHQDLLRWCQESYQACMRKCIEEGNCFRNKCTPCYDYHVMDADTREYLILRDLQIPRYDRMVIRNWRE